MRKSIVVNRSSLPIGASSRQTTSRGRHSGGASLARTASFVDAEHVAEEVLVPLARGAEQVRPPERQHAREVAGAVGVLGREAQAAGLQLADDVVLTSTPSASAVVGELERVAVEASDRTAASRAAPRARSSRRGACPSSEPLPSGRREVVGAEALVAPLVGRQVPERRRRLLARRPCPVERERDRRPAGDRAHLLLADVVRPAAAVDALAAAEQDQHREHARGRSGRSGTSGWCRRPCMIIERPFGALGVARELAGDPRSRSRGRRR